MSPFPESQPAQPQLTASESPGILPSNAQRVQTFQQRLGAWQPATPTLPSPEVLALRLTLLREEMAEVEAAAAGLDRAQAPVDALAPLLHELSDLLYVTYGAVLALGADPDRVFAVVHQANMAKFGAPGSERRRADGKLLKPADWQPADVREALR